MPQNRMMDFSRAWELDQFDVLPDLAAHCLDWLRERLGPAVLEAHDLWIEPAAGAGHFLDALPLPRIGMDVAPRAPNILKVDFLDWDGSSAAKNPIVVGTPPFGRNGERALRFFSHAAGFASRIAFVMPGMIEKKSVRTRLCPGFVLEGEMRLPGEAFDMCGMPYATPAIFQVWSRAAPRPLPRQRLMAYPGFGFSTPIGVEMTYPSRVAARAFRPAPVRASTALPSLGR